MLWIGCSGGFMSDAFKWLKENGGIMSRADYPFKVQFK